MYNECNPLKMQDRETWIPFPPSAQSKIDLETIKTTMDSETNFISGEIWTCLRLHKREHFAHVCLLEREREVDVIKREAMWVWRSALRSAVKPADAEQRRAKKHQAAESLFYVSEREDSHPAQNDPCPPRAPGASAETGIQMRALYAAICSTPLHPWCHTAGHPL